MRTLLGALTALLMTMIPMTAAAMPHPDAASDQDLAWQHVDVPTTQGLRGLDAVSDEVAWVTGSKGGVWRTTDGGQTWDDLSPGPVLALRDVEATSATTALALAIGEGADSQILRTDDGGETWTATFVNDEPAAFYDCLAMYPNGRDGLALSDPVDGQMRLIRTSDGGRTWSRVDPAGLPAPVALEFYFAASGTCLVTSGGRDAWIVSGGGAARVLHSTDRGATWSVADSTLAPGAAAGAFSIAVRRSHQAVLVGGDFEKPTDGVDRSAYLTRSGAGVEWVNGGNLGGYRSGVSWLPGSRDTAVAVGPSGTDVTTDGGRTWSTFAVDNFDAVDCARSGPAKQSCWASGAKGAVARLVQ